MPIPPAPLLDETINPGQSGHIADHEAIHSALNNDTMSLAGAQVVAGAKTYSDGSFLDAGNLMFDVRAFLATGNGSDEHAEVAAAFAACGAAGGGTVYFPPGTWGNAVGDWDVPDNCRVYLSAGATLKALTGIGAGSKILNIEDVDNVQVDGHGIIDGNKATLPTSGLFGVSITGDSNHVSVGGGIKVINMPGTDAAGTNGGDGFYIGPSGGNSPDDVKLLGVSTDGTVRQGISVVGGTRIRIIGPCIKNVTGSNPGAGIDVEPNVITDIVDVLIDDFQIYNCARGILVANTVGATSRVHIGDGTIDTTRDTTYGHGIHLAGAAQAMTVGNVTLIDTKFHGVFIESSPNAVVGTLTIRNPNVARVAGGRGVRISGAASINWSIGCIKVSVTASSGAHTGLVVEAGAGRGSVGILDVDIAGLDATALRIDESADVAIGVIRAHNSGNLGTAVFTFSTGAGCTGHTIGTLKAKGFDVGLRWNTSVADCSVGVANLKGNTTPYVNAGTNTFIGNIGGPAYTIANLTTDRAYDADATTLAEVADVVGTFIGDVAVRGTVT